MLKQSSIPLQISELSLIEISGEVVIKSWFEKNKWRESKNGEHFYQIQNAASGSLRQLDPSITAKKNYF